MIEREAAEIVRCGSKIPIAAIAETGGIKIKTGAAAGQMRQERGEADDEPFFEIEWAK